MQDGWTKQGDDLRVVQDRVGGNDSEHQSKIQFKDYEYI